MKQIEIRVEGSTPLLMNRMPIEVLEGLRDKTGKKAKYAPRPKDPKDEAAPKVYQTEDGHPIIPTENLMAALIEAGKFIRLDGKRQLTTNQKSLVPGILAIEEPFLLLTNGQPGKKPEWTVDMRQGKNPNGGEAVCIVRPRFNIWGFRFSLLLDDEQLSVDRTRELVDRALGSCGLCDFRPERKGIYGKSKITEWKVKE